MRPQRIALEDHDHARLFRRQRPPGARDDHAIHLDHAGAGLNKTGNHSKRGGLTAARRTKQRNELALGDLQIEIINGDLIAKTATERTQRKAWHCICYRIGSKRHRSIRDLWNFRHHWSPITYWLRDKRSRPSTACPAVTTINVIASRTSPRAAASSKFPLPL